MTPGQKAKFRADMVAKARKAKALEKDRKAAGAVRVNVGARPKRSTVKAAF
jgi:hypothetical protein